MRPRQWIKNLFVVVPLIFTGEFINISSIQHVFFAAIIFCIASSAAYIVNDIHDIENDRKHPKKSETRPLASGKVSIRSANFLLFLLYAILILVAFLVPQVLKVILIYICLNYAYTYVLKHQPVVDIFTIAIGFVLRVYAGASALLVTVSGWMFVTTLFLALYLASVKRRQ
jgi:4-hydroxybenzoate polyprenyltransferase